MQSRQKVVRGGAGSVRGWACIWALGKLHADGDVMEERTFSESCETRIGRGTGGVLVATLFCVRMDRRCMQAQR